MSCGHAVTRYDVDEEKELGIAYESLITYVLELEEMDGKEVATLIRIGAAMATARVMMRQQSSQMQRITSTGQPGDVHAVHRNRND